MNIIQYVKLYNYLSDIEKMSGKAVLRTILRIRKLPLGLKNAIIDVMDGLIPNISIHSVTLEELINEDDMTPVRAILFLDWLRREPKEAMKFMSSEILYGPITPLTKESKDELKSNIERLKALVDEEQRKEIEEKINPSGLNDQSDITLLK